MNSEFFTNHSERFAQLDGSRLTSVAREAWSMPDGLSSTSSDHSLQFHDATMQQHGFPTASDLLDSTGIDSQNSSTAHLGHHFRHAHLQPQAADGATNNSATDNQSSMFDKTLSSLQDALQQLSPQNEALLQQVLTQLQQDVAQIENILQGGGGTPAGAGSDTGSGTSTTAGSDTGSGTTTAGSDTGSSTTTTGSDTGSSTTTPSGSDSGSVAPAQPGPVDLPPVKGTGSTPTDAASALAGFEPPTNLKGPVITPQFGNGKSDTQAIQQAVDQAAGQGGGVVHIPPGTYNIDAANDGIVMKSNVTLLMDKGTTLQAIPSGNENGCIIDVRNVNNVNIYGGKLVGDFGPGASHSGECMSGIDVLGSSSNIDIQGVESDKNKGDGFDISGSGTNIHLAHNVAIGNKRDGLSIEGGSNIVVENNAFLNSGTADSYDNEVPSASRLPVSGIDIENSPGQSVSGAIIRNNLLEGNGNASIDANTSNGWGIRVTGSDGNNSQVVDNTVVGNAAGGVGVWSGTGNVVSGNTIESQPHPYVIYDGTASGDGNTLDGSPVGPGQ